MNMRFLAILLAMACTVNFAACSSDDEILTEEETTEDDATEKVDGLEVVRQYFFYTDASGEEQLVRGAQLDDAVPTELSIGVEDEDAALAQFSRMVAGISTDYITYHSETAITVTLADTLGEVYGTAYFAYSAEADEAATVTFEPEDLLPEVSKVCYIYSSMWPENAEAIHHEGDVHYYTAPMVVKNEDGVGYLTPNAVKTVPLVCVNDAEEGETAYYIYFDTVDFSPEETEDMGSAYETFMQNSLPTKNLAISVLESLICTVQVTGTRSLIPIDDLVIKSSNYKCVVSSDRYQALKTLLASKGVELNDTKYYYTGEMEGYFSNDHFAVIPSNFQTEYKARKLTSGTYKWFDGEDELYPYMLIVPKAYDATW
ncbi:MAG: hypothetical protein Q4D56_08125 [Bacteroides sp.]|nr:hypothetical protein [Bacteroides sp.]